MLIIKNGVIGFIGQLNLKKIRLDMKICRICQKEKDNSYFEKNRKICKLCRNNQKNESLRRNPERLLKKSNYQKKKRKENLELIRKKEKEYKEKYKKENLKDFRKKATIKNGYLHFDINTYNGQDYHIKPCSSFDLTKENEQKKCFHWSNLQILKANENLIKSNKV